MEWRELIESGYLPSVEEIREYEFRDRFYDLNDPEIGFFAVRERLIRRLMQEGHDFHEASARFLSALREYRLEDGRGMYGMKHGRTTEYELPRSILPPVEETIYQRALGKTGDWAESLGLTHYWDRLEVEDQDVVLGIVEAARGHTLPFPSITLLGYDEHGAAYFGTVAHLSVLHQESIPLQLPNGREVSGELMAYDRNDDWAIVRVAEGSLVQEAGLTPAPIAQAGLGHGVAVSPFRGESEIVHIWRPERYLGTRTHGGYSGAPVYNLEGQLVGFIRSNTWLSSIPVEYWSLFGMEAVEP